MQPQISYRGPEWFCVVVAPGCHRHAENYLRTKGFRCFVPKIRKWVSHARVRKAIERPLWRYLFVEVDYPRQSFATLEGAPAVESIISWQGIPCVIRRDDVEDLMSRYLSGEFDEVSNGQLPVGARVVMVEGKFNNWLATVTGHGRGGRLTVKLLGENKSLNKVAPSSVAAALGSDLRRTAQPEPA